MIDTHSLLYRGTMALNMSGKTDTTINNFDHWYRLNFMQYIHGNNSHLVKRFSTYMSSQIPFSNIGSVEC